MSAAVRRLGAPRQLWLLTVDAASGYGREGVRAWQIGWSGASRRRQHAGRRGRAFDLRIYLATDGQLLATVDDGQAEGEPMARGGEAVWGRDFGTLDEVRRWLAEMQQVLERGAAAAAFHEAAVAVVSRARHMLAVLARRANPVSAAGSTAELRYARKAAAERGRASGAQW